jgi:hypothetical protein
MEIIDAVLVGAFAFTAGFLVGFGVRSGISARRREAVRRRRAFLDSILAERSSVSNVEDS